MRTFTGFLSLLPVLGVFFTLASADRHAVEQRGPGRRHHGVNTMDATAALSKRFDNARYSNYDITTGPVACGGYYQPGDFVSSETVEQSICGDAYLHYVVQVVAINGDVRSLLHTFRHHH